MSPSAVITCAALPLKKVVVIDAGHGGKDVGASGVAGFEKDVNLAAALTLADQLTRSGRYKVVMTRSTDVYVPLESRVRIAQRAGADLFISLHSDSAPETNLKGASVYTLSDKASSRATRFVSRDDSAATSFFYTGVAGAVVLSFTAPFYWTALAPVDWVWMALLCATGISSHYFLIRAYDLLDATAVQPLTYLQVVLAAIIGITIFGETLSLNMVIGSVIVVAAGIFTIWRESVVARRRAQNRVVRADKGI